MGVHRQLIRPLDRRALFTIEVVLIAAVGAGGIEFQLSEAKNGQVG